MIARVYHLVSYLSEFMTLYPGDIIATGTPDGVGAGMNPQCSYNRAMLSRWALRALANNAAKSFRDGTLQPSRSCA